MDWNTDNDIDYEDAQRPTADDPNNPTGWVAYYAWGRGGGGMHTPQYIATQETDFEQLRDYIVRCYESWMEHAQSPCIVVHRGVLPPASVIEKRYREVCAKINRLQEQFKWLDAELGKARAREATCAAS